MLLAIVVTALWLRHEALLRRENLVRIARVLRGGRVTREGRRSGVDPHALCRVHAPGRPHSEQQRRAGDEGSGRIADLGPALDLWLDKPILGRATRYRDNAGGLAP